MDFLILIVLMFSDISGVLQMLYNQDDEGTVITAVIHYADHHLLYASEILIEQILN